MLLMALVAMAIHAPATPVRSATDIGLSEPAGAVADLTLVVKSVPDGGGVVTVDLDVDERGRLAGRRITGSTGSPAVDALACRAVRRQLRFESGIRGGRPVCEAITRRILLRTPDKAGQGSQQDVGSARQPPGWLKGAEHPADAARLDNARVAEAAWDINVQGLVENCRIISSSGDPDLDKATCDNITRRGRYRPATDAAGKPVRSSMSRRIRWERPR